LSCCSPALPELGPLTTPWKGSASFRTDRLPRVSGTSDSPGYRASQQISDPEHYRTGVVVVTLNRDTDTSNIVSCVILGQVVNGTVTLLDNKRDFAVRMCDSEALRLVILPYQGWRLGGEYVLRFLAAARYRGGRPLTDPRAEWVIPFPLRPSPSMMSLRVEPARRRR
jgi:hypothetical protein